MLQAMVREGFLKPERAETAAETPLFLATRPPGYDQAPYFVAMIKEQLLNIFGPDEVYKGGLTVKTTLDQGLQAAAESALRRGLAAINRSREREQVASPGIDPPEMAQGALVALDVGSGEARAWVGGNDFRESPFDRAAKARRQPGSALKPLIYAQAVEMGLSQADIIWDAPISYSLPDRALPWTPQNFNRRYEGETTLRRALEASGNIPAIKLLGRIGIDPFIRAVHAMGVSSPLTRDLTLALGSSAVGLAELLSAYQALANGGLWIEPHFISEIIDRDGRSIFQAVVNRRPALSPESAFIVTDMLEGVVQDGTAQRAKVLGRAVAGKTGTTDGCRDASFYGYSPELAAGVWVGLDSGRPLGPEWTGARAALPIWVDFMEQALEERPILEFTPPAGVVMAYMNRFTGKGCRPGEQGCVRAAFRPENRPAPVME
ncbi:MAG: penicillin-binding transpeptidase domain-containing protein [Pseudomonadota bacterium]